MIRRSISIALAIAALLMASCAGKPATDDSARITNPGILRSDLESVIVHYFAKPGPITAGDWTHNELFLLAAYMILADKLQNSTADLARSAAFKGDGRNPETALLALPPARVTDTIAIAFSYLAWRNLKPTKEGELFVAPNDHYFLVFESNENGQITPLYFDVTAWAETILNP